LTVVGQDEAAQQLRQLLHQHDIATVLRDDKQLHTIVKLRVIGRAQQLIRIDFENEPDHEVLSQMLDAFEEQLPSHDLVLFSDYGKGGLTH
ncbi:bifunctional heptose 7-phosphate kinase/heptose 1-phosphate adenyltransferase, partial [Klebsiella quasipneumoniae]|nr:bifunctional heptose 7-phosphate kinase/heptose 1-phosphate adenyltransferase [Klebsiella quasipneumoniae]